MAPRKERHLSPLEDGQKFGTTPGLLDSYGLGDEAGVALAAVALAAAGVLVALTGVAVAAGAALAAGVTAAAGGALTAGEAGPVGVEVIAGVADAAEGLALAGAADPEALGVGVGVGIAGRSATWSLISPSNVSKLGNQRSKSESSDVKVTRMGELSVCRK